MLFVIYLSNEDKVNGFLNGYGYYCGKAYTKAGEVFPLASPYKNDRDIKWYTSEKIAGNAAKKISDKCAYVTSYRVEQL